MSQSNISTNSTLQILGVISWAHNSRLCLGDIPLGKPRAHTVVNMTDMKVSAEMLEEIVTGLSDIFLA